MVDYGPADKRITKERVLKAIQPERLHTPSGVVQTLGVSSKMANVRAVSEHLRALHQEGRLGARSWYGSSAGGVPTHQETVYHLPKAAAPGPTHHVQLGNPEHLAAAQREAQQHAPVGPRSLAVEATGQRRRASSVEAAQAKHEQATSDSRHAEMMSQHALKVGTPQAHKAAEKAHVAAAKSHQKVGNFGAMSQHNAQAQQHALQHGVKGGTFYVNEHGQKVYAKK